MPIIPIARNHRHLEQLRLFPGRKGPLADGPPQAEKSATDDRQRHVEMGARAPGRPADDPDDLVVGEAFRPGQLVATGGGGDRGERRGGYVGGADRLNAALPLPETGTSGSSARRRINVTQGSSGA